MGLRDWKKRVFPGDLVGKCQLHAPGLPQAPWLAATLALGGVHFFSKGGEILEKVWEHFLACLPRVRLRSSELLWEFNGTAYLASRGCHQPRKL